MDLLSADLPLAPRPGYEQTELPEPASDSQMFKVPAGESPNGGLVLARAASPRVEYHCPGCGSPLLLRRGPIRAPHFAHKAHGFCSPETVLHQGVKHWIARALGKCLKGRRTGVPRLLVPCGGAPQAGTLDFAWRCPGEAWLSLADLSFDEVAVERTTSEGLRPDVLLLLGGQPALGIEVRVHHAVDAAKAARTPYPWVEVDAQRVLAAPRAWKPEQHHHPWTGQCQVCACVGTLTPAALSEVTDAGDYVAQLAAAAFHAQILAWLQPGRRRLKPAVVWRCPACRKRNVRALSRDRVRGAGMASSLLSPVQPQVIIELVEDAPVAISFGFPRNPYRPWAVVPIDDCAPPTLRATPDLKQSHRLALNGTNRPLAFPCRACGADCIGAFPSPLAPLEPADTDWDTLLSPRRQSRPWPAGPSH